MKKIFTILIILFLIGCVQTVGAMVPIANFDMYESHHSTCVYPCKHIGGYAPLSVYFMDTTAGWSSNNRCYFWNFGDGTTDSSRNGGPTHTYNSPGTYYPTLSVGNAPDANSCSEKYLLTQSPRMVVEVYSPTPVVTTISTTIPTTVRTTIRTPVPTMVPTKVPTTISTTIPTAIPTATINYSATIAEMQKQIADLNVKNKEPDNWIDQILRFLGLK